MSESLNWTKELIRFLHLDATASKEAGSVLASLGAAAQALCEQYTGRTLTPTPFTLAVSGNGRSTLYLAHDPIISVESITENGNALTVEDPAAPVYPHVADVGIHEHGGALVRYHGVFCRGNRNVLVSWTAGYTEDTLPQDLVQSCVELAASKFKRRDVQGFLSRTTGAGQTTSYQQDVPKEVLAVWDRHRRWMAAYG